MFFASKDGLKELFYKSGFEILGLELFEFTTGNMNILNSWYHVRALKPIIK